MDVTRHINGALANEPSVSHWTEMSFIISVTDVDTGEELHYKLQQPGEQVGRSVIFSLFFEVQLGVYNVYKQIKMMGLHIYVIIYNIYKASFGDYRLFYQVRSPLIYILRPD